MNHFMDRLPANLRGFVDRLPAPPRTVLLEPNLGDRDQIIQIFEAHFGPDLLTPVANLAELLGLDLDQIDLVISVTPAPDATGLQVLEEILLLRPDMPIILTACHGDMDEAIATVREGAYDYMVKGNGYTQFLPVVIEKNMALHRIKQENARLQVQLTSTLAQLKGKNEQLEGLVKELETIAATDSLTGIANRRAISAALNQRFAQSQRGQSDIALLVIDMDGFKSLNDTLGHPVGDRMLTLTARVMLANCRASDVPGRIGGDEFVIVLPETGVEEATAVAERIQSDFDRAAEQFCGQVGYTGTISISMGLTTRKLASASNAEQLLSLTDQALYTAKAQGKRQLSTFSAQG